MKKRIILILLFVLSFISIGPLVKADMGPKPSLKLMINSYSDKRLYIELLIKGNNREYEFDVLEERNDSFEYLKDFLVDKSYNGYVSATINNGAPFWSKYLESKGNSHYYNFGYRMPRTFKVMIYDLESNTMFITNEISVRAFDSSTTIDLSNLKVEKSDSLVIYDQNITIREVHNYWKTLSGLLVRLVLTVIIEVFVLFLFSYKKKASYVLVIITNLITQIILTFGLFIAIYYNGSFAYIAALIIGEILVLLSEIVIYRLYLKEHGKYRSLLYAVVANILSLVFSLLI
ncbi:hypothetical protein [Haploplasma axanthum]|uniref:Uncharacterized protein n=1 Tax=Haploplasma axanthum TaxID=29552 RepID=A0A449BEJ1_HAPAX|nr:hypothetical protein [Haploplasma axanthum]VEU80845.1 Uncharacterised protein [Haploplasma axanthum]